MKFIHKIKADDFINNNNNFDSNDYMGIKFYMMSEIFENNIGLRIKGSQQNKFENNIVNNNNNKGFYFCCGAVNNIVFNNSIFENNINADDHYNNQWYYNKTGNYWGNYSLKYPNSIDEKNDGIWDTPYLIYENTEDLYPLVESIMNF